jgi:O-antigen/teichoic acid export membrane protein
MSQDRDNHPAQSTASIDTRRAAPLHASGGARHTVINVGWSSINTGSAVLIAAMVFVITSRILGPEEFGSVALAIAVISLVSCATPAAFGEAIIQRLHIGNEHLDTVFWLCIMAGVVLYVPLFLAAGPIAIISGQPLLGTLLPFIGIKLLIDMVAVVPQAIVIRAMQFKYIAARTAIGNSAGGLVCVVMALNGHGVWALAAAPVITSLVSMVILLKAARWRPGRNLRLSAFRDLKRFGLFQSGTNMLHFLRIDLLVLGFLAGPATLGLYFLGRRLLELLTGITAGALQPVSTVFFASIQKDHAKHIIAFRNILQSTILATFPLFAGLYLLAAKGVPLVFGDHWQAALPAIEAFAVIGFLSGLHTPTLSLAMGLGRADLWLYFDLIRQTLVVGAIALFLPYGLASVMIALMVVNAAVLPWCFIIARKLIGISLGNYLEVLLVPLVATIAMSSAILAVPLLWPALEAGMLLGIQMTLAVLIYILVVFSMSGQKIAEIRRVFSREKSLDV